MGDFALISDAIIVVLLCNRDSWRARTHAPRGFVSRYICRRRVACEAVVHNHTKHVSTLVPRHPARRAHLLRRHWLRRGFL